jgi:hypothetical protein
MTNLSVQATSDNDLNSKEAGASVSELNTGAVRDVKYKAEPIELPPSTRKYTILTSIAISFCVFLKF